MMTGDLPPSFQKASLEGKVAVVTGSTQGLGEATARLFRERGCKGLVLTGRSDERGKKLADELTTDSCRAVFIRANLEDLDEVRKIFRVTDMTFGTVHILVNAAATTDRGSLWDTTPEDYDRIMNVNTRAPFFLMQDAARIMEREKVAGSIINISSTASYGSMPMIAAYGMSKGALNVATKNAAYSLMWSKIRVNALAIGWMDTPGEDSIQRRDHCGSSEEDWKAAGEANQPFGRLLKPEEVARCIAFCASDESGMMTGCVIDFDQSVWGAGNAPVPPPKEQWAKANGMTFSFEKSSKATAVAEEPSPKTKRKTTEKKEPKKSSKKASKDDSKGSGKTTPKSTPRSSPKVTQKRATTPKRESTPKRSSRSKSPGVNANASPKTAHYLSSNRAKYGRRKSPGPAKKPSEPAVGDGAPMIPDLPPNKTIDEKKEIKARKKDVLQEEKKEITPPVSPDELPKPPAPKISEVENPPAAPYPEDLSPNSDEFKRMLKIQEDDMHLDDYLPGTAKQKYSGSLSDDDKDYLPSSLSPKTTRSKMLQSRPRRSPTSTQRKLQDMGEIARPDVFFAENNPGGQKKERSNKKIPLSSVSDHGDYRAARVQDWLGGDPGMAQRRSYKVKQVRKVPDEKTGK